MSVLFVSTSELPDQSANATRIVNLAKTMKLCDEEPLMLGTRYDGFTCPSGMYDGLQYYHVDASGYMSKPRMKRVRFIKDILNASIREIYERNHFRLIVISGFDYQSLGFIFRFAKANGIAVAINSVEWYEKNTSTFDGLNGKIKFIKNRYGMMVEHKKAGNIIAISSLLNDYYQSRGCNTVRIPTIVDKDKYFFVPDTKNEKMIVSYAGSPARKDYIGNAIKALQLLAPKERNCMEFHLYGATVEQIVNLGISQQLISELDRVLFIHGRIPYSEVQEKIAHSDFTVLLRPNLRYANAGFPTKVGESMMCGTPVIANITSDLGRYIRDNETGIVASDESPEACAKAFQRAMEMNDSEKKRMRLNARAEAEKSFYYAAYAEPMKQFIKGLKVL